MKCRQRSRPLVEVSYNRGPLIIHCTGVFPSTQPILRDPHLWNPLCEACDTSQLLECTCETGEDAKVSTSESKLCFCEKGRLEGVTSLNIEGWLMTQVIHWTQSKPGEFWGSKSWEKHICLDGRLVHYSICWRSVTAAVDNMPQSLQLVADLVQG